MAGRTGATSPLLHPLTPARRRPRHTSVLLCPSRLPSVVAAASCLPTCLPTCLPACLPTYLPACLLAASAYLPVCQPPCPWPDCLHACLPVCCSDMVLTSSLWRRGARPSRGLVGRVAADARGSRRGHRQTQGATPGRAQCSWPACVTNVQAIIDQYTPFCCTILS